MDDCSIKRDEADVWYDITFELKRRGILGMRHTDKLFGGMPDCSLTYQGITTWNELKVTSSGESTFGVRDDQIAALFKLCRAGAPTWVTVFNNRFRVYHCFGMPLIRHPDEDRLSLDDWYLLKQKGFLLENHKNLHTLNTIRDLVGHLVGA